ncbi:MAG: hypothetical protein SPD11_06730, partial [Sphaerochaetaceae bacterium]|nr:hypothetical protein [Sphaerochaetaceae bacterium]
MAGNKELKMNGSTTTVTVKSGRNSSESGGKNEIIELLSSTAVSLDAYYLGEQLSRVVSGKYGPIAGTVGSGVTEIVLNTSRERSNGTAISDSLLSLGMGLVNPLAGMFSTMYLDGVNDSPKDDESNFEKIAKNVLNVLLASGTAAAALMVTGGTGVAQAALMGELV